MYSKNINISVISHAHTHQHYTPGTNLTFNTPELLIHGLRYKKKRLKIFNTFKINTEG